ncbi:MAG: hypothetical protein M5U28_17425 [Sandaracinaceae bacterium]|nr:hypothetical protein [Sandaracinaceae bacterium]
MPRRAALFALTALACSGAGAASALDVQLDTDTSFQLYEVRSPGARAFLARRRLLSRLSLRVAHQLEEPDDAGRALRLVGEAQLRLEQDFGETCLLDRELCVNALDPEQPSAWQPLAADTRLDVPAVWIELSGPPLGTSARLGRQLVLDPIGFARFDGLRASAAPLRWLEIEALAGLLVRGTSLAATPRSDPQGSIPLESERAVPWAAPPADTWVVGGALEGRAGRFLRVRLSARHMWEQDGEVLSRVALGASSQPLDWLTLSGSGVWDLLSSEVIQAAAEIAAGTREVTVRAGVDHHVPRFDPGTIWAWFTVGAHPADAPRRALVGERGRRARRRRARSARGARPGRHRHRRGRRRLRARALGGLPRGGVRLRVERLARAARGREPRRDAPALRLARALPRRPALALRRSAPERRLRHGGDGGPRRRDPDHARDGALRRALARGEPHGQQPLPRDARASGGHVAMRRARASPRSCCSRRRASGSAPARGDRAARRAAAPHRRPLPGPTRTGRRRSSIRRSGSRCAWITRCPPTASCAACAATRAPARAIARAIC